MRKNKRFIAELREAAKQKGLTFRVNKQRGKGSHSLIWVGDDKVTTMPSREIDPKTAAKIKKALGLE